jgi:hypothetical protein
MSYLFNPDLRVDASGNVYLTVSPTGGDSSLKIATTAFVAGAIASGGTFVPSSVAITGGTIDGTALGATTASTIKGTTGNFSGLLTLAGTGTALTVTNNATIGGTLTLSGTGAFLFPSGTTSQEPDTGNAGEARYNTTTGRHEFGIGGSWVNFVKLSGDTMTGALIVNGGAVTASGGLNATGTGTGLTVTNNATVGGTIVVSGVTTTAGCIFGTRVVTASGTITQAATDHIIIVNKTTGAATTLNLMASPATGFVCTIKDGKGDAATNNITITPNAGTIDGAASVVMSSNYASVDLCFNGTNWNLL